MGVTILLRDESCILQPESENVSISYSVFLEAVERLEYGCPERVMLLMLAYTGCRVSELDWMFVHNVQGNTVHWQCGKNQHRAWRKETLPDGFLEELRFYRAHNRCDGERLFGWSHKTWRRMFNKAREQIGGVWAEHTEQAINCSYKHAHHVVQPRALRKVFQTILFCYYREKYSCSDTAILRVSKRMRHSSKGITAEYYIENSDVIEPERWILEFYSKKPSYHSQVRLTDFLGTQKH